MDIKILERKIIGTMNGIKNGTVEKEKSGIGSLFLQLKSKDEALYEELLTKYKKMAA
jgi:hypothetical protein